MLKKAIVQTFFGKQTLARAAVRSFATGTKLAKFDFQDPFVIEDLFTEDEKMVRDSARQFAQEKLLPRVRKAYNDEHFDKEIMREMGAQGFLGCTIPEYNLPGISSTAYGLINREIERVDSGYRSALSVQSSLVMYPIYTYANKISKQQIKNVY